jgi:hypothetical protein
VSLQWRKIVQKALRDTIGRGSGKTYIERLVLPEPAIKAVLKEDCASCPFRPENRKRCDRSSDSSRSGH